MLATYLQCLLMLSQCVSEGWSDKLKEQAEEGCNVAGKIRVNKVVGNIQLSPGRSFRTAAQNIYDLVPYLRDDKNRHDFTHTIHEFGFESDQERNRERQREFRATLGIENPLDRTTKRVSALTAVFRTFSCYLQTDRETAVHVPVLLESCLDAVQHVRSPSGMFVII